jgi:hypothetical protein
MKLAAKATSAFSSSLGAFGSAQAKSGTKASVIPSRAAGARRERLACMAASTESAGI